MSNEYLDALKEFDFDDLLGGYERSNRLGNLKRLIDADPDKLRASFTNRPEMVNKFAWAIPNEEAIEKIAALSPIIEIGAGRGYWAYLLRKAGAEVVAIDRAPHGGNAWHKRDPEGAWTTVERGNASAVKRYPTHTLMLCWPPYGTDMGEKALRYTRADNLVYVGEEPYGCTGSHEFHEQKHMNWELTERIAIPQWLGIHDHVEILKRRATPLANADGIYSDYEDD